MDPDLPIYRAPHSFFISTPIINHATLPATWAGASRLQGSGAVVRQGGEECVALLPDTDLNGAQSIAQALVTALA